MNLKFVLTRAPQRLLTWLAPGDFDAQGPQVQSLGTLRQASEQR